VAAALAILTLAPAVSISMKELVTTTVTTYMDINGQKAFR
jgi:hypothetical protein